MPMQVTTVVTLVVLQGLTLVILYQLVKQQGRLLLRLDDLGRRLTHADLGAGPDAPALEGGLAVGTPVSSSRVLDLEGRSFSLDQYRGERVLLVHWSPGCGFCELLAPDLAK